MIHYRWINIKKKRYYKILFAKDLFGDWIVTKAWGGITHPGGGVKQVTCFSYEEGIKLIEKIATIRKRRGYTMVSN